MKAWSALLSLLMFSNGAFAQQIDLIAPSTFVPGKAYPLVTEAMEQGMLDRFYTSVLPTNVAGGQLPGSIIKVKKGRGMATVATDGSSVLTVAVSGQTLSPSMNMSSVITHSGTTSASETWASGSVHRISAPLMVSSNDTLHIEQGCWVLLDSAVNIHISGHLQVTGTRTDPVVFCANGTSAWGGLVIEQGSAELNYVLFNNAGGDLSQTFGHSNSQGVVRSNGGQTMLDHCFIFDCPGKAMVGSNGRISFSNGGISRCDTGGEFAASHVSVRSSHILDIPNDDGLFQDDDNDGFYFSGTNAQLEPNVVDSCIFMFGKDDAIDHNGAILEVRNCWAEGFEHEGVAASNGNSVLVYNSLFKDCEQGIEAGYGSPQVTVNHCVMVNNDYGLRFGDWYDWGCSGHIECTNSIMIENIDNVYNYDVLSNGPVNGAIDISYSILSDSEYDGCTACLTSNPVFDPSYHLVPGSAGTGAASDGSDIGLIAPVVNGIRVPTTSNEPLLLFKIYDLNGRLLETGGQEDELHTLFDRFSNGIYLIKRWYRSTSTTQKTAIFR